MPLERFPKACSTDSSSFRRKPESRFSRAFRTPAFAGVTELRKRLDTLLRRLRFPRLGCQRRRTETVTQNRDNPHRLIGLIVLLPVLSTPSTHRRDERYGLFQQHQGPLDGTEGCEKAADYIMKSFKKAGLSTVEAQKFLTPIPELVSASIEVDGEIRELHPWDPIWLLPMTRMRAFESARLRGEGKLTDFDNKPIKQHCAHDMESYGNWLNAACSGPGPLFCGEEDSTKGSQAKNTNTPVLSEILVSHKKEKR